MATYDDPATVVRRLAPVILEGGENLEPLVMALHEAQVQCCEDGIAAIFVPHGEGKLAIVETDPDKTKIMVVRGKEN